MKNSLRIMALLLAAVISFASAAEPAAAAEIQTESTAEESGEDIVSEEETDAPAESTAEAEEETPEETKAKKKNKKETTEDAEETTKAAKKKKGNLDKFVGLDSRYLVLATAKKKVYVYKKYKDKNSKVIGKFTKNNCIVVDTRPLKKGRNYTWVRVYMKNKKKGYIPLSRVSLGTIDTKTFGLDTSKKKNRTRIKICQYGLPYIGTRFRLGGSSLTKGIDCSTFARQAFRNAGVMVGARATARVLSNTGKKIARSQLKAGDMVFYPHNSRDLSIGHCAIYIGNGYIINASGHQGSFYPSGGIRFSKIDYRKPTASKFRNIVGN